MQIRKRLVFIFLCSVVLSCLKSPKRAPCGLTADHLVLNEFLTVQTLDSMGFFLDLENSTNLEQRYTKISSVRLDSTELKLICDLDLMKDGRLVGYYLHVNVADEKLSTEDTDELIDAFTKNSLYDGAIAKRGINSMGDVYFLFEWKSNYSLLNF